MTFVLSSRAMASDVDEIRGALPRRWRVLVVGDAKGNIFGRQQSKNTRRVPARVTKLESIAPLRAEHLEKGCQTFVVQLELRRQLKQHRACLVAQNRESARQQ